MTIGSIQALFEFRPPTPPGAGGNKISEKLTRKRLPAVASSIRAEPFGCELRVERLTAEKLIPEGR